MEKNKTFHKKKTLVVFLGCMFMLTVLIGRLVNLMVVQSEYYAKKADDLHERERKIKAARGRILDANGVVLADNKTVCTISVIHSQIKEPEKVIAMLTKELGIDEAEARKRVNKISSIERVKTNVEKEVGDKIREYQLAGVKVDEDFRRFYPYGGLASRVLGFTGGDNQGIIGLEVKYEEVCCHSGNTNLRAYKDRSAGSCHDTVGSCGRNAHSKNDTAEHGKNQCDHCMAAGNGNNRCNQLRSKTCGGDTSGNHTCHSAGYSYGNRTLCTCFQSVNTFLYGDAVVFIKDAYNDGHADGNCSGELHSSGVCGNKDYEHYKRSQ